MARPERGVGPPWPHCAQCAHAVQDCAQMVFTRSAAEMCVRHRHTPPSTGVVLSKMRVDGCAYMQAGKCLLYEPHAIRHF